MTGGVDAVFKKVLNDRDIFDSPYDRRERAPIPKLFEGDTWKELSKLFNDEKREEFVEKVESRIREIKCQEQKVDKWRRGKINELEQRAEWLKSAFDKKPYLLKHLFEDLEWYGLVECKLPNMDQYGKVVERYDVSIIKQYFASQIKRAAYPQSRALEKVLEYVSELHAAGVSPEKIAYFVRKLDSLTTYWEVIKSENKN